MVQGEDMDIEKTENLKHVEILVNAGNAGKIPVNRRRGNFPGMLLFLAGFLIGMLIPNLSYRFLWKQQAFSAVYLLSTFGKQAVSTGEYLGQIIQMRSGPLFLLLLCGFTVFGVPSAVGAMLMTGMGLGMVFAMSVLEFGLAGGAIALGLLFPQYILYLPALFGVLELVYKESLGIWRNHGVFPRKVGDYLIRSMLFTAIYGAGIFLEWYINPWVLRQITRLINFF